MRVAILSGNARPADAIGNQVAEKVALFLERGADVRVFVEDARRLHPAIASHCQAVEADCLDARTHDFLAASDLVLAEFGHYHSLLGLLPLSSRLGRRILVDYHGITPLELCGEQNREPIAIALRRRGIVWYADAALVHSEFTQDEILADTGFPRTRTFVLGHPIDVKRFRADGSRGSWRRRLGLTKDDMLLLFVGRVARNKRIDILIEALSHLPEHVSVAIAGDVGDIYALEAVRCRRLAGLASLSRRIHWLGQVADSELPALYRAANVFVTASEHEGFCIPVAEALCSGTPVVASRAGALPETLGGGGLLFAPGDAADLARQLQRLLFDEPGLISTLKKRGRAETLRFARPHWRQQFGRLVEQVLDMPPRPMLERLELEPASDMEIVSTEPKRALVAVRLTNAGSHPVELGEIRTTCLHERPGIAAANKLSGSDAETPKSQRSAARVALLNNGCELIMPGRSSTVPLLVGVPREPGTYTIKIQIEKEAGAEGSRVQNAWTRREGSRARNAWSGKSTNTSLAECRVKLNVTDSSNPLQTALAELAQLGRLPEGYEFETNGRLGRIKAWLKEKLLGGFRRRYVDVLSRQQSAANGFILTAIAELNGRVARLQRVADIDQNASESSAEVLERVRTLERRVAELQEAQGRVMT